MRNAGILLLLAAAWPGSAQMAKRPATVVASIDQPRFSLDIIKSLEATFDSKLETAGPERLHVMGYPRGVYIPGYGLVLTAELDLTFTPMPNALLNRQITADDRTAIHGKKLAQIPMVEQIMRDMAALAAQKVDMMPQDEHIAVVVRMDYQSFEDRTRLPAQILMSADRKSATAGLIKEDFTK